MKVPNSKAHPGDVRESAAMAAVQPPPLDYTLHLPGEVVEKGLLSDVQLESIARAGAAHSKLLPKPEEGEPQRRGFLCGDGTGVGKGRIVAGTILDNFMQGRKKAVWLSISQKLFEDAKRDWRGLGQDPGHVFNQGKLKASSALQAKEGILFTTYSTLRSQAKVKEGDKPRTRVDQIVEWLGADFDGAIVFDEAHAMANAVATKGARGVKAASGRALAGLELQERLPNARVLYVSATAATEAENLAYMERLGLWGAGTPSPTKLHFLNKVSAGGVAAMEIVARDLKAQGLFLARNLSYDDVEFERVEHVLTEPQREMYDTLARAWQLVLQNVNTAIADTNADKAVRGRALSQFWGAHQRFFNQIVTAMQVPAILKTIQRDLDSDRSVVIQLTNTHEAAQERELAKRGQDDDLEDFDLTPRDMLLQYIDNCFPTQEYETYEDENGVIQSRPVVDSQGNPVHNQEALKAKRKLLEELGSLAVPQSPMDMLIDHFGRRTVAEVTGRKRRVVKNESGKTEIEQRGSAANASEIASFMDGKKRILIFSEAGGTGASYHADKASANQQQRAHYVLQAGWRADRAVQGMGRSHRSNQASAPVFLLVTTDLKGQKRFISTIARRLEQLGALSKGQRQAGATGLFGPEDNLESAEAREALHGFYRDLHAGKVRGMGIEEFESETGLRLRNKDGGLLDTLPPIRQFLNRLLSLTIDRQNKVFGEFESRLKERVEIALSEGTLDQGLETYRAQSIKKAEEQAVYTHPESQAQTRYVRLTVQQPLKRMTWAAARKMTGGKRGMGFILNKQSGRIYAAAEGPTKTMEDGRVLPQVRLYSPTGKSHLAPFIARDNWDRVKDEDAEGQWTEEYNKAPKHDEFDEHLVTGVVLPIWDRIVGKSRIVRMLTDEGEHLLGLLLPEDSYRETLRNLKVDSANRTVTAEEAYEGITSGKFKVKLANGWEIKRTVVAGEARLEVLHVNDYAAMQQIVRQGGYIEQIQWKTRLFLPVGDNGQEVIGKVLDRSPVVDVVQMGRGGDIRASMDVTEKTRTPEFKRWFGDWENDPENASKVVDKEGRPLRVYHGTRKAFTEFDKARIEDEERGFFFTSNPQAADEYAQGDGGNIMPVYLRIGHPYETTNDVWTEGSGLSVDEARDQDFDGYIISGMDGGDTYIAFAPDQIRPAFDDFRASMEEKLDAARQWVGERMWKAGDKIAPKTMPAVRHQLQVGDKNERGDLSWVDTFLRTPMRYMNKVPALQKLWASAENRRRVRHEIVQALFGVDARSGRNDLKAITDYEKGAKAEYKDRWAPYVFRRDRDAVGYYVMEREGSFLVMSPGGVVVDRSSSDEAAWLAAYLHERADALEGRDWVRSDTGIESRKVKPMSQAGADALMAFRMINDRTWRHLYDLAQKAKEEYDDAGKDAPVVNMDGEEISIFEAMRQMGDRRGYYMPRLRKGGRHLLFATKEGENPRLEIFDTAAGRYVRAVQLEKQGWDVEKARSTRPSEEAFLDANVASLNDLMKNALAQVEENQKEVVAKDFKDLGFETAVVKYKRKDDVEEEHFIIQGYDRRWNELWKSFGGHYYDDGQTGQGKAWHFVDEEAGGTKKVRRALLRAIVNEQMQRMGTVDLFGRAVAQQCAVLLHSRGSRARKIGRSGETGQDVWLGYEQDPLRAVTQATSSVAGGTAKAQMAKEMINAVMGVEMPWRQFLKENQPADFAKLDPNEQQRIRHDLWEQYDGEMKERRIDSGLQPEAFKDAQSFIREVLRNEEPIERVFGMIKGVAALKYLTGLAPGVVNLTSLGTTVPAVFHQEGQIPFAKSLLLITKMSSRYSRHLIAAWRGNESGLGEEDRWLFGEFNRRGWDEALMNQEAVGVMSGQIGRGYRKLIELGMMAFSLTERLNRASTIAAGYYGLREQLKGDLSPEQRDKLLEQAKKMADSAHAVYGKENLPSFMRGSSVAQQAMRSAYMYRTYSHNLLQMMVEMGVGSQKDRKALAYLLVSLPILAGPKAFIGTAFVGMIAKMLIAALGGTPPDDPEEAYYGWVRDTFGTYAEWGARGGLVGLAGVDISGSVSMQGFDIPVTLSEFLADPEKAERRLIERAGEAVLGPAGQLVFGYAAGGAADLARGRIVRAAEKLAPRAIASPIRAAREYIQGVQTGSGRPVFYGEERLRPSVMAAVLRGLSFNPMEVSAKRTRQWSESQTRAKYDGERQAVYDQIDRWSKSRHRDPGEWVDILAEANAYNRRVRLQRVASPMIEPGTIKARLRRQVTAPVHERRRNGAARDLPALPDAYDAEDILAGL